MMVVTSRTIFAIFPDRGLRPSGLVERAPGWDDLLPACRPGAKSPQPRPRGSVRSPRSGPPRPAPRLLPRVKARSTPYREPNLIGSGATPSRWGSPRTPPRQGAAADPGSPPDPRSGCRPGPSTLCLTSPQGVGGQCSFVYFTISNISEIHDNIELSPCQRKPQFQADLVYIWFVFSVNYLKYKQS
jgi:hypothetical protein